MTKHIGGPWTYKRGGIWAPDGGDSPDSRSMVNDLCIGHSDGRHGQALKHYIPVRHWTAMRPCVICLLTSNIFAMQT